MDILSKVRGKYNRTIYCRLKRETGLMKSRDGGGKIEIKRCGEGQWDFTKRNVYDPIWGGGNKMK